MGAAHLKESCHASLERGRQYGRFRPWARDNHVGHTGGACRNRRHQQRRRQGVPASRHIAGGAIQRCHPLFDDHAGGGRHTKTPGQLFAGNRANVIGRFPDRAADRSRNPLGAVANLTRRELDRAAQVVELACIRDERPIAAPPHPPDDLAHALLDRPIAAAIS